jgi:hypothetical protein
MARAADLSDLGPHALLPGLAGALQHLRRYLIS